eukprot:9219049-Karenia_brevis.AAC.1
MDVNASLSSGSKQDPATQNSKECDADQEEEVVTNDSMGSDASDESAFLEELGNAYDRIREQ